MACLMRHSTQFSITLCQTSHVFAEHRLSVSCSRTLHACSKRGLHLPASGKFTAASPMSSSAKGPCRGHTLLTPCSVSSHLEIGCVATCKTGFTTCKSMWTPAPISMVFCGAQLCACYLSALGSGLVANAMSICQYNPVIHVSFTAASYYFLSCCVRSLQESYAAVSHDCFSTGHSSLYKILRTAHKHYRTLCQV